MDSNREVPIQCSACLFVQESPGGATQEGRDACADQVGRPQQAGHGEQPMHIEM